MLNWGLAQTVHIGMCQSLTLLNGITTMNQAHNDMSAYVAHNVPTIGATFSRPAPHHPRPLSWLGRIIWSWLQR